MRDSTRKTIDNIAELLHRIIFADHIDYRNLDTYFEAQGINVKYLLTEKFDGYLRWDTDKQQPIIAVSALNAPVRQNFTKAHELGHLVLHWKWLPDMSQDKLQAFNESQVLEVSYRGKKHYTTDEQTREIQANEFAAAFLIPNYKLEQTLKQAAITQEPLPQLIKQIARQYFVAEATAKIRLKNYQELTVDDA